MNKIIFGLCFLFGATTWAQVPAVVNLTDLSVTISTVSDSGNVYYACDAVEAAAEDLIYALGGTKVSVSCSGGIDQGWTTPATLETSYSHLITAKAGEGTLIGNYVATQLEGRETSSGVVKGHSCHLMRELFNSISKTLDLQEVDARFSCSGSFSKSYEIKLLALK